MNTIDNEQPQAESLKAKTNSRSAKNHFTFENCSSHTFLLSRISAGCQHFAPIGTIKF